MTVKLKTLGRSSMNLKISVEREDLKGNIEDIASGDFVFVSVKDRKSVPHKISFEEEIILD